MIVRCFRVTKKLPERITRPSSASSASAAGRMKNRPRHITEEEAEEMTRSMDKAAHRVKLALIFLCVGGLVYYSRVLYEYMKNKRQDNLDNNPHGHGHGQQEENKVKFKVEMPSYRRKSVDSVPSDQVDMKNPSPAATTPASAVENKSTRGDARHKKTLKNVSCYSCTGILEIMKEANGTVASRPKCIGYESQESIKIFENQKIFAERKFTGKRYSIGLTYWLEFDDPTKGSSMEIVKTAWNVNHFIFVFLEKWTINAGKIAMFLPELMKAVANQGFNEKFVSNLKPACILLGKSVKKITLTLYEWIVK